jgi:hypothetical protein
VRRARVIALIKDASERQAFKSGEVDAIAESDQGDLNPAVREATNGKSADLASGVWISYSPSIAPAESGIRKELRLYVYRLHPLPKSHLRIVR